MFNASNIRWHIVMKGRITITASVKDKDEAKKKTKKKTEETEPDSNLTRTTSKVCHHKPLSVNLF